MKFQNSTAGIFIPDGKPLEEAFRRTTHMGIGAHQDDLEFMALHPILECYQNPSQWFTGVTVTDGGGSSRINEYASFTDDQMKAVRRQEQNKAAALGEYSAMISLDYPSAAIKKPNGRVLIDELKAILTACKPRHVHTHNLADKHDTHLAVTIPVIQAIRELPEDSRPQTLYGCEVWRSLDWMGDDEKVILDVSARENLSQALMGLFDSQISGGKRYDQATLGRKRANATYLASHQSDKARLVEYAMDLTPLVKNPKADIQEYVQGFIQRFSEDVRKRIQDRLK